MRGRPVRCTCLLHQLRKDKALKQPTSKVSPSSLMRKLWSFFLPSSPCCQPCGCYEVRGRDIAFAVHRPLMTDGTVLGVAAWGIQDTNNCQANRGIIKPSTFVTLILVMDLKGSRDGVSTSACKACANCCSAASAPSKSSAFSRCKPARIRKTKSQAYHVIQASSWWSARQQHVAVQQQDLTKQEQILRAARHASDIRDCGLDCEAL